MRLSFYFHSDGGSITIRRKEYARLLQKEIDLLKTSEKLQRSESLVKAKASEIKLLQTQVLYYKKRLKSNRAKEEDDVENTPDTEQNEDPEIDVK